VRRALLPALAALVVVLAGCGGGTQPPRTPLPTIRSPHAPSVASSSSFPSSPATDTGTPSAPAGSSVAAIYPPGFDEDVTAANVPPAALIPLRTTVIGTWYADTSAGQAIVVGWEARGQDPFRTTRGFVAWRHFDDGGSPWRPVYGAEYRPKSGVQSIHATIADVTGDGEPDALVQALSGITANCGEYTVVDLAAARPVFARHVCDAAIEPSTSPPGLRVSKAVYAPGDAHCCPSATRVTVLTLGADGSWTKASSSTVPAG
jgi:hypothetical protein